MLYDPKWEVETKTQPSFMGLIAWLETKNPKETYNWGNCEGECLIHQYLCFCGIERKNWNKFYFSVQTPPGADNNAFIAVDHPWTFGAALERARAALTEA